LMLRHMRRRYALLTRNGGSCPQIIPKLGKAPYKSALCLVTGR
jgi:hypothetical protein